jgi:hypothetical protein
VSARCAAEPTRASIRLHMFSGVNQRNGWGGCAADASVRPSHRDARIQLMEVAK